MLGRRIHPTSSAQKHKGLGSDEPNLIRCAQCGMINDLSEVKQQDTQDSPGLELSITEVATLIYPGGTQVIDGIEYPVFTGQRSVAEMIRVSGCRFCGSHNINGGRK